jgi:hypothetical protein
MVMDGSRDSRWLGTAVGAGSDLPPRQVPDPDSQTINPVGLLACGWRCAT